MTFHPSQPSTPSLLSSQCKHCKHSTCRTETDHTWVRVEAGTRATALPSLTSWQWRQSAVSRDHHNQRQDQVWVISASGPRLAMPTHWTLALTVSRPSSERWCQSLTVTLTADRRTPAATPPPFLHPTCGAGKVDWSLPSFTPKGGMMNEVE